MSILVDLIPWFCDKPENIFTRGLHSVLKHPEVMSGLLAFLKEQVHFDIPITQLGLQVSLGPDGQPDLEGLNEERKVFFGEVKFGAPLTKNQPEGYLNALAPNGLLLFIVPKYRWAVLWSELQERLLEYGSLPDAVKPSKANGALHLTEVDGKSLALVTGPELLKTLLRATEEAKRPDLSSDVGQLQAFWDAYDTPDLPPVTKEMLRDGGLARLACGLAELPRKIANAVDSDPLHARGRSLEGDNSGSTSVGPVHIGNLGGWIIYSPPNWKKYGSSPIWFELGNIPKYVPDPARWPAISCVFAQRAGQPRNQPLWSMNYPSFAITLPLMIAPNSIEFQVVDHIVDQLRSLASEIRNFQND